MIGVLGAMKIEIEALKNCLSGLQAKQYGKFIFYTGKCGNTELVVAQCGIGLVAAGTAAAVMTALYKPSLIINIGVAGGVREDQQAFDIIVAKDVVQYDMDTTAFGDPIGYISGLETVRIKTSGKYSSLLCEAAGKERRFGTIASGNAFVSKKQTMDFLADEFDAFAVDMESAAIGQACTLLNIEFCILRIISDNGGFEDFNKFAEEAAKKAINIIQDFVKLIEKD